MIARLQDADSKNVEPAVLAEDLTAVWLGRALGGEVSSASLTQVGTGQMGECYRIDLAAAPELPLTVIAKLPTANPLGRELLHASYAREVGFYRDLRKTLSVRSPHAYYAGISKDPSIKGVFTLLMEDLAPAVQGDQIVGCSPAEALRAVENVAGLHAPRWADRSLIEVAGFNLPGAADAKQLEAVFPGALLKVRGQLEHLLVDADIRTLDDCASYVGRWVVARQRNFALIHGDYRLDNLLFHPDGRIWAVDWQTISLGLPARDVAFFLATGLSVDDRRDHESRLVEAYRRELVSLGVSGYTPAQCWDDYRFALLHTLVVAILGCAYSSVSTERGDQMFATMISRGVQAIRDLETVDMLREL